MRRSVWIHLPCPGPRLLVMEGRRTLLEAVVAQVAARGGATKDRLVPAQTLLGRLREGSELARAMTQVTSRYAGDVLEPLGRIPAKQVEEAAPPPSPVRRGGCRSDAAGEADLLTSAPLDNLLSSIQSCERGGISPR